MRVIFEHSNYLKMLSIQFVRSSQSRIIARWFTRNSITRSNQVPKSSGDIKNDEVLGTKMHRVTNFDRRLLVWVKRYPSFAEVPDEVSVDCLLNSRSKARIKSTNYLMVAAVIGCIGAVILGKRAADKGENLHMMRDQWLQERLEKDKNK
ncbi:PREDICTED: UPF0389 protein GA21628-like isoform X2 [Dinoponera quadriceps]|uniref:UPF0389 protein GA21628-like isoform X2 n=1 Tax=Dinoponera quadriceps TaxID=609295 RepID=A0A6P3WS97_DINQU|nr:PREDICTED: UPF0389 protein GA21628-like isoform X2 [Dinoponera quadriceps]